MEPSSSNGLRLSMVAGPSVSAEPDNLDPSDDESEVQKNIVEAFNKLSIKPMSYRYHGKSSGLVLIRAAHHLKDQVEADTDSRLATAREKPTIDLRRPIRKQFATSPVSLLPLSLRKLY